MAAISYTLGEIWDYQKSLDSKVKINIVAAPAMILTYMHLFDEYGIQNAALGMLAMSLAKAVLQFSIELYEKKKKNNLADGNNSNDAQATNTGLFHFLNENKASLGLELLGISYLAFMAGLPHILKSTTSIDENTLLYLQPAIDNFAVLLMVSVVSLSASKYKLLGEKGAHSISEQLGSSLIKHKGSAGTYQPLELDQKVWRRLDRLMMFDAFVGLTMGLTAFVLFQGIHIDSLGIHSSEGKINEDTWFEMSNVWTKASLITCSLIALYTLWNGRKEAINNPHPT